MVGKKRYFMDFSEAGDWYLIPVENRGEWEAWIAMDFEEDGFDVVPEFATPITSQSKISFLDPKGEDQ